jgi:hypothetical protein
MWSLAEILLRISREFGKTIEWVLTGERSDARVIDGCYRTINLSKTFKICQD